MIHRITSLAVLFPSNRKSQQFFLFTLLAFTFFSPFLTGQISEAGVPYSFQNSVRQDVETIYMPGVDVDALLLEDAEDEMKGVPYRFGYPMNVDYNLYTNGTWENLPDGGKLWRLTIVCPEAITTNLIYSNFFMPPGAKLYLYNENRSEVLGAFTSKNNKETGEFATGILRGESVTLEYYEPVGVSRGKLTISHIIHGYKNVWGALDTEDFGQSGSCNINVNCPDAGPWANPIRSVAMILTASNSRLCTGSMVNNVRQDLTPYFLTANHCMSGSPNTWIIMFNYQSPTCSPNVNGPLNYTVQGTQTKATNSASDFALLLLNEAPPDTYYVHFNGWSAIDEPSQASVGIHHPRGDVKKISWDHHPVTSHAWSGTPANSHWRIGQWEEGTTEPGSSGSPLFDQNKRLVGQLHGGAASCTVIDYDSYGKFSFSWNYGTTPSTRLRDWLDPDNTGTLILDGWDPTIGDPDTVPPSVITDLAVSDPTSNSLKLSWTAPLDTSFGGVRAYDVRMSTSPITDTASFSAATQVSFSGSPAAAGSPESMTIPGLNFSTTYYFAIRSNDMWHNYSNISNVASGITFGAPQASVNPTSLNYIVENYTTFVDTVWLTNATVHNSTLDFSVMLDNNSFPEGALKYNFIPVSPGVDKNNDNKEDYKEPYGISLRGSGGPDPFGYSWIDSDEPNGPQYVWNDISTTGTLVTNWIATGTFEPKDEGYAGPFPFGFNFKFYGENQTQIYVNSNGILLFAPPTSNIFTNAAIPNTAAPNNYIAPFWDDLDGRTQGTVHYQQIGNKFYVQFTNWQRYSASGSLTFQTVLHSNGRIEFFYNNMNTTTLNSATVGIENSTGTVGLQVVYNANYIKNNLAVKISADPEWATHTLNSGTLYNGNAAAIQLTFDTQDYPQGNYSIDLIVNSNDPVNPTITVPISLTIDNEIPVELTSFAAEVDRSDVLLRWITATELNNSGFQVERKTDGADWSEISFVSGFGTTTEVSQYSYRDQSLNTGKYTYRLKQIDFDGTYSYSSEIEVEVTPPNKYALYQNYPNPFNPNTVIEYSVPEPASVTLQIYSIVGELVSTYTYENVNAGYHKIEFDASNLSSGTYVYQIIANGTTKNFSDVKKMMLVK